MIEMKRLSLGWNPALFIGFTIMPSSEIHMNLFGRCRNSPILSTWI